MMQIISLANDFADWLVNLEVYERVVSIDKDNGESIIDRVKLGEIKGTPPQPIGTKLVESLDGEVLDGSYHVRVVYDPSIKLAKDIFIKWNNEFWRIIDVLNWTSYSDMSKIIIKLDI